MAIPPKIWLYRITHYSNLPHILKHGLVTSSNKHANPGFISIGDHTLIEVRKDKQVPIQPFGHLSEYIPFYFGPRSPMLLQIKTGNQGVQKRDQSEIIYIISSLDRIQSAHCEFCFTDGHAWDGMTQFYNNITDLDKVDWGIVNAPQWANTEDDIDRKRKKQAEFLIKKEMPITCVEAIVVYNDETLNFVKSEIHKAGLVIQTVISEGSKHYYR